MNRGARLICSLSVLIPQMAADVVFIFIGIFLAAAEGLGPSHKLKVEGGEAGIGKGGEGV